MKKRNLFLLLVVTLIITLIGGNVPVALSQAPEPQLKIVSIEAKSRGQVQKLVRMGLDISAVEKGPVVESKQGLPMQTYHVEVVVSANDEKKLDREGFSWTNVPGKGPVKKIGEPYEVYKSFDEPISGIKSQLYKIAST